VNPRRLVPTPAEATSGVERERSRAGHSTRASSSSPARSHHRHHLGYLSRLSRSRSASIARRGSGRSRASRAPKGAGDPAGRFVAGGPPMPGQTYSRLGSLGGAPSPPPVPPAVAAVASLQRGGGGPKGSCAARSGHWAGAGVGDRSIRGAREGEFDRVYAVHRAGSRAGPACRRQGSRWKGCTRDATLGFGWMRFGWCADVDGSAAGLLAAARLVVDRAHRGKGRRGRLTGLP